MKTKIVSRRTALTSLAAVGTAGVLTPTAFGPAIAKAPFRKDAAPAFYSFMHGTMQLTVVSDGPIPVGAASGVFAGLPKEDLAAILERNFRDPERTVLEQNVLVVNTGDKLVLIDAGMGASTILSKVSGRLLDNLAAAGIAPADIDAVIVSHAHLDHVGGLTDAKGALQFPNAQVYITEADFTFWTDEAKLSGDFAPFVKAARDALLPYRDRAVFIKDGQEIVPGIVAIAAPGHTVGHTIYAITSGGKTLVNIADIAHHKVLGVEKPKLEFIYDGDKAQAVATRIRVLDMLAKDRTPILAYHFDWPGVGYISKEGDGFRYHAAQTELVPTTAQKG